MWDRRAESGRRGSVSGAGTSLKGAFFAPRQSLPPTRVLGPGEACLVGRRETGSSEKTAGRRFLPFAGQGEGPEAALERDPEAAPPWPRGELVAHDRCAGPG